MILEEQSSSSHPSRMWHVDGVPVGHRSAPRSAAGSPFLCPTSLGHMGPCDGKSANSSAQVTPMDIPGGCRAAEDSCSEMGNVYFCKKKASSIKHCKSHIFILLYPYVVSWNVPTF